MTGDRPDSPDPKPARDNEETIASEAMFAPSDEDANKVTKASSNPQPAARSQAAAPPPAPAPVAGPPDSVGSDETTNWSPSKLAAVVAQTIDAPAPRSDATADWSNLPGAGTGVVKPRQTEGSFPSDMPTMARGDDMKDVTADFDIVTPNAMEKRRMVPSGAPRVDGYEVLDVLGRGGMGIVFKAKQSGLDRLVALKMVLAGSDARPDELDRFKLEAKAVARLNHENIVQIFDVGEKDGTPYFSLEYVDGGNLGKKVDKMPQPPKDAALMVEKLARAMQVAHEKGIVHRDLKPANILLTAEGEPKITDFGLAKLAGSDSGKTRDGSIMGTPSYMAPEQARGAAKEIGPPTDIYSLGAVLYDLLVGRPPFQGTTVLETLDQVRKQEPLPPTDFLPKTPKDLETIALKCLQKEPNKRYETAQALADDLRRYLEGRPIMARRVSTQERLWRWCRRNPVIASLLAASFMLLTAVAVISTASAFAIAKERDNTKVQRDLAIKNEGIAKDNATLAIKNEGIAKENEKIANVARERADASANAAIQAVRGLLFEVQKSLGDKIAMQGVKREILKNAFARLEDLRKVNADGSQSELITRSLAQVHGLSAQLAEQVGDWKSASAEYDIAYNMLTPLYERSKAWPAPFNMAQITTILGHMARDVRSDYKTARDYFDRAVKYREEALKLKSEEPGRKIDMMNAFGNLAITSLKEGNVDRAQGELDESQRWWEELPPDAKEHPGNKRELAGLKDRLAEAAYRLGRTEEAKQHLHDALAVREGLQQLAIESKDRALMLLVLRDLALSHMQIGDIILFLDKDPVAAGREYETAQKFLDQSEKLDPDNVHGVRYVSNSLYRLGVTHSMVNQLDLSKAEFTKCVELRKKLLDGDPEGLEANAGVMTAQARLGDYKSAVETADELVKRAANDPRFLFEASCAYSLARAAVEAAEKSGQIPPVEAQQLATQYGDKSINAMKSAIAQGWSDAMTLYTDPDLDETREDPRFKEVVKSLDLSGVTLPGQSE